MRLLKDVDAPLEDRHVLLVEDVVDTGLTLHFLCKTLGLAESREPRRRDACSTGRTAASSTSFRFAIVGFTVPDELFAGYGLGLDERWRALPDLHLVSSVALSARRDRSRVERPLRDTAADRRRRR